MYKKLVILPTQFVTYSYDSGLTEVVHDSLTSESQTKPRFFISR